MPLPDPHLRILKDQRSADEFRLVIGQGAGVYKAAFRSGKNAILGRQADDAIDCLGQWGR